MKAKETKRSSKSASKISPRVLATLIVTLVVISIFPLYVTFTLESWPLQTGVMVVDVIYLCMLAAYVAIFTGWYRPKWLITLMMAVGILGATATILIISFIAYFAATFHW